MSIERQTLVALKWGGLAKLITQVASWAVTLVVLRLLAPEDYGLMALSAVIVSVMATIAELGLGASLIQAQRLEPNELSDVSGAVVLANLACGAVVVLTAPLAAYIFNDVRLAEVIRVSALHFLLHAVSTVPQSMAQRAMRFRWLAAIDLGAALLTSIFTLGLAITGAGVWSLVLGGLAGAALRALLFVALGDTVRPRFHLRGISRHLRFGGAITSARLLWQVLYQADILIAGRFLSQEAVGLYSVSMHVATLPMQKVMGIVNQVAFPAVSRLQDEMPRLRARLLDASRLMGSVSVPALWGMSAVAPELVATVLGKKWLAATFPLQVVCLFVPMRMLSGILATALSGLGRADLDLRNTLMAALILPAAFIVGVQFGASGLALAWAITSPIVFAINFPSVARTLGLSARELAKSVRAPVLAGLLMYAAVEGARQGLAHTHDATRLVLLIGTGGVIYLSALMLLDRALLGDVKRVMAALKE